MQCGDVCIHGGAGKKCYCGWERLDLVFKPDYCCVDQSHDNRTQCSVDRDGHGHCPQGWVVNYLYTCNNHCYNDYETSASVGLRSRYYCSDLDACTLAKYMCYGYILCPNSREVSECDENLKCTHRPDLSHSNGVLVSELREGFKKNGNFP